VWIIGVLSQQVDSRRRRLSVHDFAYMSSGALLAGPRRSSSLGHVSRLEHESECIKTLQLKIGYCWPRDTALGLTV
jgi:hypothetical protein